VPGLPRDDLRTWCRVRDSVAWPAGAVGGEPLPAGPRDGFVAFVRTTEAARDAGRAERLLGALDLVRADATATGTMLSFDRLAGWHAAALGTSPSGFRTSPAYAKGGRERYGVASGTPRRFGDCLAQATASGLPLPARAARAYLDVLFFHPFPDGNARAAMLALYFLLARERAVPDLAAPALVTARRADDADGAGDLARLLAVLIDATARRARARPGSRRPLRTDSPETGWAPRVSMIR
jgi:hypothetical protein